MIWLDNILKSCVYSLLASWWAAVVILLLVSWYVGVLTTCKLSVIMEHGISSRQSDFDGGIGYAVKVFSSDLDLFGYFSCGGGIPLLSLDLLFVQPALTALYED